METGIVFAVDASNYSYRVRLNSGRVVDAVRMQSHSNDLALLRQGELVAVSFDFGPAVIIGVLPGSVARDPQATSFQVTDVTGHGGEDPQFRANTIATARTPSQPTDLMPGDAALVAPDGAVVAALRGRVASLRGGALAKVEAFGEQDLLRFTAGNVRMDHWGGYWQYSNDDAGRINYSWRLGSDQLTQTGADAERFTIQLDAGADSGVVRFSVQNREGQALFSLHVDANGHCDIYAAGGIRQHGGAAATDVTQQHTHGQREETSTGDVTETVEGANRIQIIGPNTVQVGGPWLEVAAQTRMIACNRDLQVDVHGEAREVLVQGRQTSSAGTIGHTLTGSSDYAVACESGSIRLETTGPGRIALHHTGADAIHLGTDPSNHLVMFEPMQVSWNELKAYIASLVTQLAAHTHPVSGVLAGPSTQLALPTFTQPNETTIDNTKTVVTKAR